MDLYGTVDANSGHDGDSLTNVFSSTKNLTAIMMAMAKDRGLLDYADKITKHWPEFGQEGKEDITVADLMRHESGLAIFDPPPKIEDILPENIKKNAVGKLIATLKPEWPVEGRRKYHAMTRGWVANEIFRRVDPNGRTMGEFLDMEIAKKLDINIYIGCAKPNYFPVKAMTNGTQFMGSLMKTFGISDKSELYFGEVFSMIRALSGMDKRPALAEMKGRDAGFFNREDVRMSETPSANGNCSARGLGMFLIKNLFLSFNFFLTNIYLTVLKL